MSEKKRLFELLPPDRYLVLAGLMAQNIEWLNELEQWEKVYLTGFEPAWNDNKDVVVQFCRYVNVPIQIYSPEADEWRKEIEQRLSDRMKESNMRRVRVPEPQEANNDE